MSYKQEGDQDTPWQFDEAVLDVSFWPKAGGPQKLIPALWHARILPRILARHEGRIS